ncbi:MAG: glycosyltransferase family 4 protein [Acidimicrobiales bacterium]|nr:glycosyltransferase family 4 protein [Acidimicrobiales bacterium]
MRIAFTHAFCWPEVRRGAERFIQELGAALVRRGHEVTILSAAWEPGTSELDGVRTVRLRRRHQDGWAHEADFGRRVLPRLVAGRFDAVHSMGRRDALASIRAAKVHPRRRTVVTDLGLPSKEFWATAGKEAQVVAKVTAGIDVYGCMSHFALDFLERDYGRRDGVVTPGGVDLRAFTPAPERERRPTLLLSGAFTEPRKGAATVLEALPLIAREEADVQLWLSGPGDATDLLAAALPEARARTHVLGVGDADEQAGRYGRAWATVLPSTDDSFGMALIEAHACGTPIVVSTHGAPKELVDIGVTGELCAPHDAAGFAAASLRAFALIRRPSTVEACRAAARRFDWDAAVAPLCERLYEG